MLHIFFVNYWLVLNTFLLNNGSNTSKKKTISVQVNNVSKDTKTKCNKLVMF